MSDHLDISSGNSATGGPSWKSPLRAISQESGTFGIALLEAEETAFYSGKKQKQKQPPPTHQPNDTNAGWSSLTARRSF